MENDYKRERLRIDILKVRKKAYDSYPKGSQEQKNFVIEVKAIALYRLSQIANIFHKEMKNKFFEFTKQGIFHNLKMAILYGSFLGLGGFIFKYASTLLEFGLLGLVAFLLLRYFLRHVLVIVGSAIVYYRFKKSREKLFEDMMGIQADITKLGGHHHHEQ